MTTQTLNFSPLEYEALVEETFRNIQQLAAVKGAEYSGTVDRFANFRRLGYALDLPMEIPLLVYAQKHWDAITTYCNDVNQNVQRERSEPIEGRIDDIIVYMLLLKAMVRERGRNIKDTGLAKVHWDKGYSGLVEE